MTIDLAQALPHIKIELNSSVNILIILPEAPAQI